MTLTILNSQKPMTQDSHAVTLERAKSALGILSRHAKDEDLAKGASRALDHLNCGATSIVIIAGAWTVRLERSEA